MTRTKATVKRRQQRRRLEKEAQQAQLREARESELQQHPGEEEEEASEPAIALQQNAVVEEEKDDDEEEELIRAQNDDALEQEDKEEEREREKHPEGEEEGDGDDDEGQLLLTDYEKQRERRMKENAAKLAALNLPSLALPFGPSRRPQRQSTVRRNKKDDDDYMPSSSSGSDSDDNAEENAGPLHQQAIALSLTASADNVTETKRRQTCKGKRQVSDPNDSAKKKRKGRQQQFTSDEIVAIFAIIDERGNGKFSVAELECITRSHDFTWSKQEISDMIDIFDSNKDGQLDLSEFQRIFGRMNMLKTDMA